MLRRFSLYGFLKNQQYYEPFIILALLQMGLNFTLIGFLIAFRELMVNFLEIPSGAVADVWGRRRSMVASFIAYIIHFLIIGSAGAAAVNNLLPFSIVLVLLFLSMFFFAVGEAFRTGTHKAMIFTWLNLEDRSGEKTAVYGYTRSWSKIGSAVSVVLACIFVYFTKNYVYIFFFSVIPYVLNIINFAGYPKELDGAGADTLSIRQILKYLKESIQQVFRRASLRRLVFESMGFEGFFKSSKDYLQPVLEQAALPVIAMFFSGIAMSSEQQSVILIGPVYFCLFLLSAAASRQSDRIVRKTGGEGAAARLLWLCMLIVMAILVPAMYFKIYWAMIAGFVVMYILQNIWRPVLISRFYTQGIEEQGATVLSIESQAKSLSTMLIAPVLGAAVDFVKNRDIGAGEFYPVAAAGLLISLVFFITAGRGKVK